MFNYRTLAFGLGFGLLDSIALPIVKGVSIGWNPMYMIIPFLMYAASPFIFLWGLKGGETLTILNLVWDLTSDITITLIGLYFFKERLPPLKMLGLFVSIFGLFLMTYEGNGWNDWLAKTIGGIFKL
jgi:multidrug transporter EmrE-like cation transporter